MLLSDYCVVVGLLCCCSIIVLLLDYCVVVVLLCCCRIIVLLWTRVLRSATVEADFITIPLTFKILFIIIILRSTRVHNGGGGRATPNRARLHYYCIDIENISHHHYSYTLNHNSY